MASIGSPPHGAACAASGHYRSRSSGVQGRRGQPARTTEASLVACWTWRSPIAGSAPFVSAESAGCGSGAYHGFTARMSRWAHATADMAGDRIERPLSIVARNCLAAQL